MDGLGSHLKPRREQEAQKKKIQKEAAKELSDKFLLAAPYP
jgi:hypothetical protein